MYERSTFSCGALIYFTLFQKALWSDLFTGRLKSEIPPILVSLCTMFFSFQICSNNYQPLKSVSSVFHGRDLYEVNDLAWYGSGDWANKSAFMGTRLSDLSRKFHAPINIPGPLAYRKDF